MEMTKMAAAAILGAATPAAAPAPPPDPPELVVDAPLDAAVAPVLPLAPAVRYTGTVRGGLPSGLGTATVADGGASYDGEWSGGRPHGFGTLLWPSSGSGGSGSGGGGGGNPSSSSSSSSTGRYDGQFRQGLRDGVGVRTYPDGGIYDGSWRAGRKHGLGVYRPPPPPQQQQQDGAPRRGLVRSAAARAGESLCRLSVTSSFGGGVRASSSSSPSSSPRPRPALPPLAWPLRSAGGGGGGGSGAGGEEAAPEGGGGRTPRATTTVDGSGGGTSGNGTSSSGIWLREYEHGALRRQEPLSRVEVGVISSLLWPQQKPEQQQHEPAPPAAAEPPLPTRRAPFGQAVIKGHPSHALVQALQLGLRHSVASSAAAAAAASAEQQQQQQQQQRRHGDDPASSATTTTLRFPRAGSASTPPHSAGVDFLFKDYAPAAFRRLRAAWGIPDAEYVLSLSSAASLRQLTSPGKSGSAFFVTANGRFLVKTCRRAEARVLRRMLPAYERHCAAHAPSTLLPRFFGLHRVTPLAGGAVGGAGRPPPPKGGGKGGGGSGSGSDGSSSSTNTKSSAPGRPVRFVVMSNVFAACEGLIHRRYDLKGSTEGRTARREVEARLARLIGGGSLSQHQRDALLDADPTLVLKDLDLDFALRLADDGGGPLSSSLQRLRSQLALDAGFLRDAGVMDYSLLMGVHFLGERAEAARRADARRASAAAADEAEVLGGAGGGGGGGVAAAAAAAPAVAPPPPTAPQHQHQQPQQQPPPRNFELRSGAAELEELLARAAGRCAQMGLAEGRARDVAALVRLKFLGSRLRQGGGSIAATATMADAALSPAGSLFRGEPTAAAAAAASPSLLLTSHAPPLPPPVRPPPPLALLLVPPARPPEIVPAPLGAGEEDAATTVATATTPRARPPFAALAYLRSMRGAFFGAVVADGPSSSSLSQQGGGGGGGAGEAAAATTSPVGGGDCTPSSSSAALGESMRAWMVTAAGGLRREEEEEEVLLSFGIIDVLQDYSLRKRVERRVKAVALTFARRPSASASASAAASAGRSGAAAPTGALRLSVAPPAVYAARFLDFLGGRVFAGRDGDGAGGGVAGGAAPPTAQHNGGKVSSIVGAIAPSTTAKTTPTPSKDPIWGAAATAKLAPVQHGLLSPRTWSLAARR